MKPMKVIFLSIDSCPVASNLNCWELFHFSVRKSYTLLSVVKTTWSWTPEHNTSVSVKALCLLPHYSWWTLILTPMSLKVCLVLAAAGGTQSTRGWGGQVFLLLLPLGQTAASHAWGWFWKAEMWVTATPGFPVPCNGNWGITGLPFVGLGSHWHKVLSIRCTLAAEFDSSANCCQLAGVFCA